MGSHVGQLLKLAAPLALNYFVPGLGAAIGEGLGATGAAASALGGGVLGAGTGALTGGGVKGALTGGALGGFGGYLGAGGLDDTVVGRGAQSLYDGVKGGINDISGGLGLGNVFDGAGSLGGGESFITGLHPGELPNVSDSTFKNLDGPFKLNGSGIFSGAGTTGASNAPLYNIGGGGASSFGSSGDITSQFAQGLAKGTGYVPPVGIAGLSAAPAATSSGFSKYLMPSLGAASAIGSNLQAQSQLSKATKDANAQLNPYLQNGRGASGAIAGYLGLPGGQGGSASDILAASPGYEFTRQQGNRALSAQHAAGGSLNSGAALKAAEQFGTGLADQTAQQYFSNLQNTAGQGLGAAGQYGTNTTALGTAKGAGTIATGNTLTQLLSGVGGKRVIGYGADGKPIYSQV